MGCNAFGWGSCGDRKLYFEVGNPRKELVLCVDIVGCAGLGILKVVLYNGFCLGGCGLLKFHSDLLGFLVLVSI